MVAKWLVSNNFTTLQTVSHSAVKMFLHRKIVLDVKWGGPFVSELPRSFNSWGKWQLVLHITFESYCFVGKEVKKRLIYWRWWDFLVLPKKLLEFAFNLITVFTKNWVKNVRLLRNSKWIICYCLQWFMTKGCGQSIAYPKIMEENI